MTTERIDILQEFVDLYKHEDMLAFFEFDLARAGASPVSGLCRISKPKGTSSSMKYVSLSFVADTPDDAARAAIEAALDRIESAAFTTALPAVAAVVPVPVMTRAADTYIRQMDLMLKAYVDPGKPFITEVLLPALQRLTQLTAKEVVWWDVATDGAKRPAAEPDAASPSLLGNLAARLKRILAGDQK